MKPIVLGTASPYKRALFGRLGLPFTAASPPLEEPHPKRADGAALARELAEAKARSLCDTFPAHLIIGADQVLALGRDIFYKPGSVSRAVAQLQALAGKTHCLHTAFAVLDEASRAVHAEVVTSRLTMRRNLSPAYLKRLVELDQTLDCVGAYKIESKGIALFERIETSDYTSIMGLPLLALNQLLDTWGYRPQT